MAARTSTVSLLENYLLTDGTCAFCHNLPNSGLVLLECFHSLCEGCVSNFSDSHRIIRCPISICRYTTLFQDNTQYNLLVSDVSSIKSVKSSCMSNMWVCSSNVCTGSSATGQYFCLDCRQVLCREDAKQHKKLRNTNKRHTILSKEEICSITLEELLKQMQDKFDGCILHNGNVSQNYSVVNGDSCYEKCATDVDVDLHEENSEEILDNAKSTLERSLKKSQKLASKSLRLIADLNTEFDRLMIAKSNYTLQIDEFYTEAVKEIESMRDSMLERINRKYDADLEDLNACILSVQYISELHDRCYNYIDLAYNYSSGRNLYNSHKSLQDKLNKFSTELSNYRVPNFGEVEFTINQSITDFQQAINNLAVLYLGSKYEHGALTLRPTLETPEPLQYIHGIACDNEGWIYVTDGSNHCVHVFSDNEAYIRKVGEEANLNCPIGVAVSGNFIYVSDWINQTLVCYNVSGKLVKCTQDKDLWCPRGLAISEENQEIYLADLGNNRIKVYGLDLEPKTSFKHADLDQPKDIILTGSNNLIILDCSEYFLHIFDLKGILIRHLADHSSQILLKNPSFIAIDFEGNVIITAEEESNIGIFYLPESRYIQHVLKTDDSAPEFSGLCVDCQGTLILADNNAKRIMKCLIKANESLPI